MYLADSRAGTPESAAPSAESAARPRAGRRLTAVGPTVLALGTVSLITDVSSEMVTAVLPVYLVLGMHLSPTVYGVVDGTYTGATALLRLVGGYVADRASRRNGAPHLLASIGDQGWKTRRGTIATVRPGNGEHAVGRRLIIEQNAAAAVDLQIDEAGGQEDAARETRLRPIGGNLAPGAQSSDASVPDQHRGFGMPAVTVKNTVRQDGMPVGGRRIVSAQAHRCPWQAGLVSQQIQSKLKDAEYPEHHRPAVCRQDDAPI